jgi:hypothetical protein
LELDTIQNPDLKPIPSFNSHQIVAEWLVQNLKFQINCAENGVFKRPIIVGGSFSNLNKGTPAIKLE